MKRDDSKEKFTSQQIEEGTEILIDFEKLKKIATGPALVVPVAVQDVKTMEILLLAYANERALLHTLETKIATFWSTSRNELWVKGLTSGDQLDIVDVLVNCEQNSLLYLVKMVGKGSCHTKHADGKTRFGCYYRRIVDGKLEFTNK